MSYEMSDDMPPGNARRTQAWSLTVVLVLFVALAAISFHDSTRIELKQRLYKHILPTRSPPPIAQALAPHLDLLKCSRGNCTAQQIKGLKGAVSYGVEHADDIWRTWSSKPEPPVYGFWRFLQPVDITNSTQAAAPKPKWIVITSIAYPTDAVKQWAALDGWNVLVVADTKTPSNWSYPNVTFLSVEMQQQLPLQTPQTLPFKNYARKAIGYLYAMAHGAEVIYETDDDNGPKPGVELSWIQPERRAGIRKTRKWAGPLNVYGHYGECTIWPRGFPLDNLLAEGLQTCQKMQYDSSPQSDAPAHVPVQQGLADLDPDVDAIWRLTSPDRIGKVRFKNESLLAYTPGTLSPYNTQNTVHYRSAFWGMYIPSGVNMRVCDIWRGYFAQRILWETGSSVLFVPSTVDQVRNPHAYDVDFADELQMYIQSSSLNDFLVNWRCSFSNVFDCMLQLSYDMAVVGYWPATEVEFMTAWVHDLAALGYQPPPITTPLQGIRSADVMATTKQPEASVTGAGAAPKSNALLQATSLFLSMNTRFYPEFRDQLLISLEIFYPLPNLHLTVVMDNERQDDHETAKTLLGPLLASKGIQHDIKYAQPDPVRYHGSGHDRQQLVMFWADNFTTSEYVGFIDTDTVFITQVVEEDMFEDGKPIVIGLVGEPQNNWWVNVPASTQWILHKEEVMRCMTYFPVVFKTAHLAELRTYVEKLHNRTFDEVFQQVSRLHGGNAYSQFNIMCNYMWHFHRDEYVFSFHEKTPGWNGTVPGQMPSSQLQQLLADDKLTHPRARTNIHWGYLHFLGDEWHMAKAFMEGICLSGGQSLEPAMCKDHSRDKLQENMFIFETNSWVYDKRCMAAQQRHYANVDRCYGGQHQWNMTIVDSLVEKVKRLDPARG